MIDRVFGKIGIKVRMSGLSINRYRPIIGIYLIGASLIIAATQVQNGTSPLMGGHIRRLPKRTNISEVCKDVALSIVSYNMKPGLELDTLKLKSICSLQSPCVLPPLTNVSLLWHMYGIRPDADLHRPNWCGYMQSISVGRTCICVSDVHLLPILDLKSTDLSWIYTTFLFVRDQAKKMDIVLTTTRPAILNSYYKVLGNKFW